MSAWQPIETAPKDGTSIILTDGRSVEVGCYAPDIHGDKFPWAFVDSFESGEMYTGDIGVPVNAWRADAPTHWQQLPDAPEAS